MRQEPGQGTGHPDPVLLGPAGISVLPGGLMVKAFLAWLDRKPGWIAEA